MPKITCIMPVYNTAKYLEECIESILNQTFTDFEFIISDDWSTDWSKDIIKKYAEKDNRIIFLDNHKNRWIVANLNDCLDNSSWEYIAIMESDDISMPERFEIQVKFLDENKNIDLVWWFAYTIDWNWNLIWSIKKPCNSNDIYKDLIKYSTFINPSVMFRNIILSKVWIFVEKYNLIQDYDFFCRIIYSWFFWANVSNYLIKYRIHQSASSKKNKIISKMLIKYKKNIIKFYNLKISFKEIIIIHLDYLSINFLPRYYKYLLDRLYKKIFYKE